MDMLLWAGAAAAGDLYDRRAADGVGDPDGALAAARALLAALPRRLPALRIGNHSLIR